jgi:hypothetical protein
MIVLQRLKEKPKKKSCCGGGIRIEASGIVCILEYKVSGFMVSRILALKSKREGFYRENPVNFSTVFFNECFLVRVLYVIHIGV